MSCCQSSASARRGFPSAAGPIIVFCTEIRIFLCIDTYVFAESGSRCPLPPPCRGPAPAHPGFPAVLLHLVTRPALEEAFSPLVGASARLGCPLPSLGLWVGVWDYFGCVRSYSPANFPVPYGPVKLLLSPFVESGESRAREEGVSALNDTWGSWMKMHAKKKKEKKKGGGDTTHRDRGQG